MAKLMKMCLHNVKNKYRIYLGITTFYIYLEKSGIIVQMMFTNIKYLLIYLGAFIKVKFPYTSIFSLPWF